MRVVAAVCVAALAVAMLAACGSDVGATEAARGMAGQAPEAQALVMPTGSTAASASPLPLRTTSPTATGAVSRPRFRGGIALEDVRSLESFGVRSGGSSAEAAAAAFAADSLRSAGGVVRVRTFRLPNGKTSRNVAARFAGASEQAIVLGAHIDSKYPSPGANDNGSGCAALLEIARCLGKAPAWPSVEIVLFGAEEIIDANPDHHHFGSRRYVATMSKRARDRVAGMISVDMIGHGSSFVVRTMGRGPQSLRRMLLAQAGRQGVPLFYLADPGESGWSDHEAFELAGIPAAWIEWRDDPVYHTAADTSGHVAAAKIRGAGQFVVNVLYDLDAQALRRLKR
jgi:hypothetical protein